MSCQEKPKLPSKNKHYTVLERKVFLQILNDYKHIIEIKKSDSTTLKDKDLAWNEICNKYNQSTLISQERTIIQLKKLWTNLKQSQREALTKEKQSYLATGRGPPQVQIDIDPDVASIAPHLMKTAPVLFTSNMSDIEINTKRDCVFEIISTNDNQSSVELLESDHEDCINIHRNIETLQDPFISTKKDDTLTTVCSGEKQQTDMRKEELSNILDNEKLKQTRSLKRKRNTIDEDQLVNTEKTLRMERIKRIIGQEQQLADIKQKHENNMSNMKENHLKDIYNLELQHLKNTQALEIEIKRAQLRAIESKKDKENIDATRF